MPLTIRPSGTLTASVSHRFTERTLRGVSDRALTMREVGFASFGLGLDYRTSDGAISRVTLTLTLSLGLPVWAHYRGRPAPERAEWNRVLRAVGVHEDGHIDLFKREAPTTLTRLEAATPSTITSVLDTERQRIQDLSDAYDRRTGHGTTQRTPHGTTVINVP